MRLTGPSICLPFPKELISRRQKCALEVPVVTDGGEGLHHTPFLYTPPAEGPRVGRSMCPSSRRCFSC